MIAKTSMKTVILCGGKGTRLKEKADFLPKPLIEIGNRPILWHIMKIFSYYGHHEFVLCLGEKGELIRDFFKSSKIAAEENWKITFAETGDDTPTGGRLKMIAPYIKEPSFMATYADGLSDLSIPKLLQFHSKHGKIGTVTAVQTYSPFGFLDISRDAHVKGIREKPKIDDWINGGFFVFRKEIFNYIADHDILEKKPLEILSQDDQLLAYKHESFWKSMDTYNDTRLANEIWATGHAPWALWIDHEKK